MSDFLQQTIDFLVRMISSSRFRLAALAVASLAAGHEVCAADLQAGKKQAQFCAACHGDAGISQIEQIPSLAGQPDGFIQWQLVYFRNSVRKNAVMEPLAAALKDEDIRNLGAYYASLPPPKTSNEIPGPPALKQAGAELAKRNRCASCHGDTYEGTQATPRLARQREDYLLNALRDFKGGLRTGGGVAAMPDAVYPLNDEDLKALAHFLAGFP